MAEVAQKSEDMTELAPVDRDSLYIMPLRIVPLKLPGLRRAKLVKTARLTSEIELFTDADAGQGLIEISALGDFIEADDAEIEADADVLWRLSSLSSFDVYTLRNSLRDLNIDVRSQEDLKLSSETEEKLTDYMKAFTRPLIVNVFGADNDKVENSGQLINMFTNIDRDVAIRNMRKIADMMGITMAAIPDFLEKYGDIYLSLAYFKQCLDSIVPQYDEFELWMEEVKQSPMIKEDQRSMEKLDFVRDSMNEILSSITGRFESFDRNSQTFWDNISMDSFQRMHRLIIGHHETIGGVLCGLTVKMKRWEQLFPAKGGSPHSRIDFVKGEMVPGLDRLIRIEQSAPSTTM